MSTLAEELCLDENRILYISMFLSEKINLTEHSVDTIKSIVNSQEYNSFSEEEKILIGFLLGREYDRLTKNNLN